jgi:perosamine synthetase
MGFCLIPVRDGVEIIGAMIWAVKEPFIKDLPGLRSFKRCFGEKDLSSYSERIACPENDKLCTEAVWLTQTMLLGPRPDMDQIVKAVRKVKKNAAELAKA